MEGLWGKGDPGVGVSGWRGAHVLGSQGTTVGGRREGGGIQVSGEGPRGGCQLGPGHQSPPQAPRGSLVTWRGLQGEGTQGIMAGANGWGVQVGAGAPGAGWGGLRGGECRAGGEGCQGWGAVPVVGVGGSQGWGPMSGWCPRAVQAVPGLRWGGSQDTHVIGGGVRGSLPWRLLLLLLVAPGLGRVLPHEHLPGDTRIRGDTGTRRGTEHRGGTVTPGGTWTQGVHRDSRGQGT